MDRKFLQSRVKEWREIANSFHRVAHHVAQGNLSSDYQAADLERLPARVPLCGAEQGVFNFLLHIWNHHDHPFDLSEIQRWDEDHLAALGSWVTDPDEPSRYF